MEVIKTRPKPTHRSDYRNVQPFNWTPERKKAALLLSNGEKTIDDIAEEMNITPRTLFNWRQHLDFQQEIERHILKNENFTRAGLLKECLKGLNIKTGNISEDRATHLDYIKAISDLQGLTRHKIELDANLKHSVKIDVHKLTDDELLDLILHGPRDRKT